MKKKVIRIILILTGIFGIALLVNPFLIMFGIFNIGSFIGLVLFALILIYGCLFNLINEKIKALWHRRSGKTMLSIISVISVLLAVLLASETVLMSASALKKPMENATLVVLGCQVKGKKPSLMLAERLEAAYKYLNENPKAKCVVSGGQGADEAISEAECMFNYLTEKGISPDRIYKEDKSTSTRENMQFSKRIIAKNNLNTNIAVCTNEFHEYRACLIAKEIGIKNCSAVPGRTVWWLFMPYYFRELCGIVYEWVL